MKKIASRLKEQNFTEHIDEMQLALFSDHKLNEAQREEVFKHLSQCQRCRDVLKIASEIKAQEQKLKPANNLNYKGALKRLGGVAALFLIFIATPQIDQQNEATFKGVCEEKGLFEEALEYWEKKFQKLFQKTGE